MVRNGLRELWQLDLPRGQLWRPVLQGKGYWRDVNSPSHLIDAVFRSARVGGGARRPPDAHDADLSGKDHGFRTVANSVHFSLAAEILIPYSLECGDLQGFSLSQLAAFQSASSGGGARRPPDVL